MTTNMIEVKGLRVVAGAAPDPVVEIVKGVDFVVKKGEVLALIGESGSARRRLRWRCSAMRAPAARLRAVPSRSATPKCSN